jgi:hypothetical protein
MDALLLQLLHLVVLPMHSVQSLGIEQILLIHLGGAVMDYIRKIMQQVDQPLLMVYQT